MSAPEEHLIAERRTGQLWLAIALGAFGTLSLALIPPVLPDLAASLNVSPGVIGWVQGAAALPGIFFSALIGYLSDRFGRKRVALVSVVIFTVFGSAGFVARSFELLLLFRFLQGVGTSGLLGLGLAIIGDLFSGADRTRALGFNLVGITVTAMIAPVVAGVMATGDPFRPFLLYLVGVPLALWVTRLRLDSPGSTESLIPHMRSTWANMGARGTRRDLLLIMAATVVSVSVLHGLSNTAVPLVLERDFSTGPGGRGVLVSAFQVGSALAALIVVRMRLRQGPGRSFTTGFIAMSAGLATITFAPSVLLVGVGLVAAGFGFGTITPLAQQMATEASSPAYRGIVVLSWVTVVRFTQTVAPPTASAVTNAFASRVAFGAMAVVTLVVALGWRRVRQAR